MKAKGFDKKFDDNKQDMIDDLDLSTQAKAQKELILTFLPESLIH